jgi:hypothetical protein
MWIMLNKSFLSIVDMSAADGNGHNKKPEPTDMLIVRARLAGDIKQVFKDARVVCTPRRDYRYRALLPRSLVAEAIANEVMKIDYGNFKNSVNDDDRHDAYSDIWSVMYRLQNKFAVNK